MQKLTAVRTSIHCLTDLLRILWEFVGNEKNFRYKPPRIKLLSHCGVNLLLGAERSGGNELLVK